VYPPAVNDGIIYLGNDDHSIDAWQGSDGRFLWHYSAPSQIIWDPVVLDGIMFVRSSSGTMDVLRITDGMHLWHFPLQK
jgi:outer membrane protein assembly factor BamB